MRRVYTLPEQLTAKQAHLLGILRDHPDIGYPAEFAQLAWPDAAGWRRSRKAGAYGVAPGAGMYVAAGCQLGILERRGLIDSHYPDSASNPSERRWSLTVAGARLLDEHEATRVESPQPPRA